LLFHAAIAGAAWRWRGDWDISLLDPQAGRASIALTASLTSQPETPALEIEVASPAEVFATPSESREEESPHTREAITRDDASDSESMVRLLAPVEPMIVVEENAATPVVVGSRLDRKRASRERPPLAADVEAKNLARRRFEVESSLSSPASVPAISSVSASGVDTNRPPQAVVNPPPVYPPDALAAGRTGRVIVRAEVAADGSVSEARLQNSSGVASLDRAAVSAVRQWRFSPAPDLEMAPRRVDVPIDFVIGRTAARSAAGR
jgi:protein TonB